MEEVLKARPIHAKEGEQVEEDNASIAVDGINDEHYCRMFQTDEREPGNTNAKARSRKQNRNRCERKERVRLGNAEKSDRVQLLLRRFDQPGQNEKE
ncbi:hypothetical protein [Gordoniibacillus kamchatkensis]|uniref:hypothetical protein n=1 Tax=Gordoniibacillus kamchatkensis TaxID=1590651 RepID=UPI001E5B8D50|nr:hypothetical protein [Paenibacillus sp. VKM B-2647]